MKLKKILLFLPIIIFISCEKGFNNQEYLKIDFENINRIELFDFEINKQKIIENKKEISLFADIFKDSSNYFKNETLKNEGRRPIYSLKLVLKDQCFDLQIYPLKEKEKIEIGFFEKKNNNYKKYNRFYISSKLLKLLK